MILAGAFVTLLGVQSASIQRSVRDWNKQQSMLIARQIFSAIETGLAINKAALDVGQRSGSPDKIINQILSGASDNDHLLDPENRFTATINISYWPIPNVDPEAVKRIFLTVAWGNTIADSINVAYFIPNEESKKEGEDEEEG